MKNCITLSSFLILVLLSSCKFHKKEIPEGGPCSYKTDFYPATVIDIFKVDYNMFDLSMTINTPNTKGVDTIYYSYAYGRHMDSTEIKNLNVQIGTAFKYKIMQIETGSCSPYLEQLVIEKFEK